MKGNAVLGFREYIEDESEQTQKIVIRCIGTAAEIVSKFYDQNLSLNSPDKLPIKKDIENSNHLISSSAISITRQIRGYI